MTSALMSNPQEAVAIARMMKAIVTEVRRDVLVSGVDYGPIPGTDKPVLMKPGAERLCSAFKLSPLFEVVSQVEDWERGIFFYRYQCTLIHRETGEVYGRGIGSCNSQESKYGWRWVAEDRVPAHLDKTTLVTRNGSFTEFEFAIQKAETSGKYGKPAEYWQAFNDAIANGTAQKGERKTAKGMSTTYSIGGTEYRIPNIEIFDLVNTIDKMGQKRALIAATLIATNASEYFSQDMDDFDPSVFGIKPPTITVEAPAKPQAPAWWDILKEVKPKLSAADFEAVIADLKTGLFEGRISPDMSDVNARTMLFEEFAVDIRKEKQS